MRELQLWLEAVRPRTLVLAAASIGLGLLLAAAGGNLHWPTALLTLLTATLLQVLSNLANDYGDSLHGADGKGRAGPVRAVQSGQVTLQQMRRAALLSAALAAISGLLLLWLAPGTQAILLIMVFLALGAGAIIAAIAYIATSKPYGYVGLGDLMVFMFFGPVAVLGAYYLQAGRLDWPLLLPAVTSGLLSVAVLNVNNMRDLRSDALAGKRSIPVRIGLRNARIYHTLLLAGAVLAGLAYVLLEYSSAWQLLFLLGVPLLVVNARAIWKRSGAELDRMLGQTAISTLLICLLLGVGTLLAA